MKIKAAPQILALHLKRFKYMESLGRHKKLMYRVVFPLELRLCNTVEGGVSFRVSLPLFVLSGIKEATCIPVSFFTCIHCVLTRLGYFFESASVASLKETAGSFGGAKKAQRDWLFSWNSTLRSVKAVSEVLVVPSPFFAPCLLDK